MFDGLISHFPWRGAHAGVFRSPTCQEGPCSQKEVPSGLLGHIQAGQWKSVQGYP